MGEDGARALAGHIAYPRRYAKSVNLAGLVGLDVLGNTIYEEGVCELAHSPHLAGLTQLALPFSTGKSAEELHESRYLRNLTTLRISGDFSEGVPCLLSCRFVKQLRVLDLSVGVTDENAQEIASCRHLAELRHLRLNSHVGDDGLKATWPTITSAARAFGPSVTQRAWWNCGNWTFHPTQSAIPAPRRSRVARTCHACADCTFPAIRSPIPGRWRWRAHPCCGNSKD
jgi:hypothetical protein